MEIQSCSYVPNLFFSSSHTRCLYVISIVFEQKFFVDAAHVIHCLIDLIDLKNTKKKYVDLIESDVKPVALKR